MKRLTASTPRRHLLGAASLVTALIATFVLQPAGAVEIIRQYKFDSYKVVSENNKLPNGFPQSFYGGYLTDCAGNTTYGGIAPTQRHVIVKGDTGFDIFGPGPYIDPVTRYDSFEGHIPTWVKGTPHASSVWGSQGYPNNHNALRCSIYANGRADCMQLQKREFLLCDERARFPSSHGLVYQDGLMRYTGFAMKLGLTNGTSDPHDFDQDPVVGSNDPWAIVFQWRQDGPPRYPTITGTIERYGNQLYLNVYARHGKVVSGKPIKEREAIAYQVPIKRGEWNSFVFATKFATPTWGGAPTSYGQGEILFWYNGTLQKASNDYDSIPDHLDTKWNGWIGWDKNGVPSHGFSAGLYRTGSLGKNMTVFFDKIRIARNDNDKEGNAAYFAVSPHSNW
jgi:hypothetical protein